MHRDRLTSKLGRLYKTESADPAGKQALEADLLSRYRILYPKRRRWLMLLNPWNRIAKLALTGLALCLVVVGACTTETITEVDLGKKLQVELADQHGTETVEGHFKFQYMFQYRSNEEFAEESKKISQLLADQPGVEDASVSISQSGDGDISLDILAWGAGLDENALMATLKTAYPELSEASVSSSDLSTTIKESLASKLGRTLFNVTVSGSDPEELRQQILEQMAAQGFTGDAQVEVQTEGDQQTITIEMDAE
jgi:hypothetical protein